MIEYSDYIAFSAFAYRGNEREDMCRRLASYIKNKKPSIDVHILGCTTTKILKACSFCTSCDSTTWTGVKRYGYIEGAHQNRIKTEAVAQLVPESTMSEVELYNSHTNMKGLCTNIERLKRAYEEAVGPQDYFVGKPNKTQR